MDVYIDKSEIKVTSNKIWLRFTSDR